MEESVLATFNEVNFIEGETFLTQQNWQEYFNAAIPNGIYSGLAPINYVGSTSYTDGRRFITDGEIIANGLYAKIETPNGYTDIGTVPSTVRDRFICVRIYFDQQLAQLVAKYNIAPQADTSSGVPATYQNQSLLFDIQACYFIQDESYCCERNNTYWDLPILYQSNKNATTGTLYPESSYTEGIDLRRMKNQDVKFNLSFPMYKNMDSNVHFLTGHNKYEIQASEGNDHYFYIDPINPPDRLTIFKHGNNGINLYFCYGININTIVKNPSFHITSGFDERYIFLSSLTHSATQDLKFVKFTISSSDNQYGLYLEYVGDEYTNYTATDPYESFPHVLRNRYFYFGAL